MKILILGGTGFTGRILSENLRSSEHDVTLFNRGKNKVSFPDHSIITGDRYTNDIEKIGGQDWDVIIDYSGHQPGNIDKILNIVKGRVNRYIFISSASVYFTDDKINTPVTEENEIMKCTAEQRDDPDFFRFFGNKKAEIDRILLDTDWLDVIIFRPALIYGRYDYTDRFYYWLYRANLDKFMIPDNGISSSTNTYSEDMAKVIEKAINIKNHSKLYNLVTHDPVKLMHIVMTATEFLDNKPEIVNVNSYFLYENHIQPWADLPVWMGDTELILDNSKLVNDFELSFTPFETSIKETIDYYKSIGWPKPKYGLTQEKEKEIIEKFISEQA